MFRWRKEFVLPVTCPCIRRCDHSYLPFKSSYPGPSTEAQLFTGKLGLNWEVESQPHVKSNWRPFLSCCNLLYCLSETLYFKIYWFPVAYGEASFRNAGSQRLKYKGWQNFTNVVALYDPDDKSVVQKEFNFHVYAYLIEKGFWETSDVKGLSICVWIQCLTLRLPVMKRMWELPSLRNR